MYPEGTPAEQLWKSASKVLGVLLLLTVIGIITWTCLVSSTTAAAYGSVAVGQSRDSYDALGQSTHHPDDDADQSRGPSVSVALQEFPSPTYSPSLAPGHATPLSARQAAGKE